MMSDGLNDDYLTKKTQNVLKCSKSLRTFVNVNISHMYALSTITDRSIDSSWPKEVSQSEIKISIIFFSLGLLVKPSIHFHTKMSIFNVKLRCKYLTVLKSDFRLK